VANEITDALLVANGGRVASVLSGLILDQLYDASDLRSIMQFIPFDQVGSDTLDVTLDAKPGAFAQRTSETVGGFSNSAYTTSKVSLTPTRYGRQYQVTDLVGVTGGPIDLDRIVQKLIDGVALTMTDLCTSQFPSFTDQVGTTGVDLDVDTIFDAQFALALNLAGSENLNMVLHPQQHNDFVQSLRGETGAMQYTAATAEQLAMKGVGYAGLWNGINVWVSDSVETVNGGADRAGSLMADSAICYTMGDVRRLQGYIPQQNILVDAGALIVELSRDADNGMSTAIANMYPACAIREDARGIEIVSDA
jgi:hypothetical protein